jgi:hypothetical protein
MANSKRCDEYRSVLSAYLDGEVTPAERIELLQHMAVCPACRAALEEYRAIGSRIRGLPPVVVPDTLTASIYMNTVDAPPRRLQLLTNRFAYPAGAVAAVLLVFIVAAFLLVDGYQRRIDPTIVGSNPGNEMAWKTTDPIRITFNKEMDRQSVENALAIIPTSESDLQKTWEGNTLIIGENRLLKPGTSYRISITTEARDRWGNRLSEPFTLGFTTTVNVAINEPTPEPDPTVTPTPTSETALLPQASPTPQIGLRQQTPSPLAPATPTEETQPTATPETDSQPGTGQGQQQQPPAQQEPQQPQQQDEPPVVDEPEPTHTPVPPAPTATPEPEPTPEPTQEPPPPTVEPTATPEPEPTPTEVVPTPVPTEPPAVTPTPDTVAVTGAFGNVYWRNESVRNNLGNPVAVEHSTSVEELDFQRGKMLHNLATGEIFMMLTSGHWEFVYNTASGELPAFVEDPDTGLWVPGGVFGYVWENDPYVAEMLGLAVSNREASYDTLTQTFDTGQMFYSPDGFIYVLYGSAYWELYPDAGPLTDGGD